MRPFLLGVIFNLIIATLPAANVESSAPELVRTPPEIYNSRLASLLTKAEEVLPARTTFTNGDASGVVLLSETIHYRDDSGTLYRLTHRICHVSTEGAIKALGSDTYRYDRERETMFLIEAATILADGKRQPVDAKGTFVQTPQNGAQDAVYTSNAELNIIFPNLAIGTSTEIIFLVRENTAVMPGEFAGQYTFGSAWPTYVRKLVLDLPESEWRRIRLYTPSSGVPDPKSEKYASGRERRTWAKNRDARIPWEEHAPAFEFIAPTVWFSTVSSWDSVATWFNSLIKDRSELGSELTKSVETATAGVPDRRLIIEALTNLAANEIRYTGLEFGLAGYQPATCSSVWKNHYGDCKDKANLLRAMLAYKGIKAHVALLNTDDPGRVEKESPSWSQFNHAITAIENDDGSFLFCDPTIKYAPAGMLDMSDLAREILVFKENKAVWTHTPDKLDAATKISADLALSANGELSGWFTIDSEGSDAASFAYHFSKMDKDDLQRDLQKYAEMFFPGANVVDVDFTPLTGSVVNCKARAYILRPSRGAAGETIQFPYPARWLPKPETIGERHQPYGTQRREEAANITISLPPGWKAGALPAAFTAPSDCAKFSAGWKNLDGKLVAQLSWYPERAELTAKEYSVFSQSIRALSAWLEQPVVLSAVETTTAAETKSSIEPQVQELTGFPILPTGAGQLRLVDEKYPEGERDTERRAALQKTLQWFPNDADTVFTAKMSLMLINEDDHEKEFAKTAADLLARYCNQIPSGKRAWGEYLGARSRWKINKDPAAVKQLRAIAENESLTPYRRGWSAYYAGLFMSEKDLNEAVKFLPAFTRFDSDTEDAITGLLARLLTRQGDDKALSALCKHITKERTAEADRLLTKVLVEIGNEWTPLSATKRSALLETLAKIAGSTREYPSASAKLNKLTLANLGREAQAVFVNDLKKWLDQHPPAWWSKKKQPEFKSSEQLVLEIDRRHKADDRTGAADAILQLMFYHQPNYETFGQQLENIVRWLYSNESEKELIDHLGQKSLSLPAGEPSQIGDSWLVYAEWLSKHKRFEESRKVYRQIAGCKEANGFQQVVSHGDLGVLMLKAGEIDAAFEQFRLLQPVHTSTKYGADYLFTETLIRIDRGEYDRALELIALLRNFDGKWIKELTRGNQINHLIRAASNPERLKEYWQHRAKWQANWNTILTDAGVKPHTAVEIATRNSFSGTNEQISNAVARKDTAAYLGELDVTAKVLSWIPLFMSDFGNQVLESYDFAPDLYVKLCKCLVLICGDLNPVDPEVDRTAQFWEVLGLVDSGNKVLAAAKSKVLCELTVPTEGIGAGLRRLRLLSTRGTWEELQVIQDLTKTLSTNDSLPLRQNTVRVLSDALMIRKANVANLKLLVQETGRADFDSKSEIGKILLARLETLRNDQANSTDLNKFIKSWLEKQDLGWLDHVPPTTQEDPRFSGFNDPITKDQPGISLAERMKFNLLYALDEGHASAAKITAFCDLAYFVAVCSETTERTTDIVAQLGDQNVLPVEKRGALMNPVLFAMLKTPHLAEAEKLHQSSGFETMTKTAQDIYNHVFEAVRIWDKGDEGWPEKTFQALTANPLDTLQIDLVEKLLRQLALNGNGEQSDRLVADAKNLSLFDSSASTVAAIRFRWARAIREAKAEAPLLKIFREIFASLHVQSDAPFAPAQHVSDPTKLCLTAEEALRVVEDLLHNNRFGPNSVSDLFKLLAKAHCEKTVKKIAKPLLSSLLASTVPDSTKHDCLLSFYELLDVDNSAERQYLTTQLETFLSSSESRDFPLSRQAAVRMLAHTALRTSTEPRPSAIFTRLDQENFPDFEKKGMRLQFLYTRGEEKECLSIIDGLDADSLLESSIYAVARAILRQSNRASEASLLDEAFRAKIVQVIPNTWLNDCDPHLINFVVNNARIANAGDLVSDIWFKHVVQSWRDPLSKARLENQRCWLRQDWIALFRSSDEALSLAPDMYDTYYDRAIASYHLGNNAAAQKDLNVFIEYARSNLHYQEALALLNELSGKTNSEPSKKPLTIISPDKKLPPGTRVRDLGPDRLKLSSACLERWLAELQLNADYV